MKKTLKIEDFEMKKTSKGKDYARFKTSEGWMSCFDKNTIEELKKNCGNEVEVDLMKSGDFENIKKIHSTKAEEKEEQPKEDVEENQAKKQLRNYKMDKKEMYVSYAKDVFCAIITRISQAKFDEFEEADLTSLIKSSIKVIRDFEKAF